jgi:HAD superfamily hydrolase (TIGR01509 family)
MNTQAVLFDLGGVLVELGGVDYFGQLIGERDEAEIWRRWLTSHWVRSFERGRCTREEFARGMVQENTLDITPEAFLEVFENWPRGLFPGAEALVHAVNPHLTVACLSNTNELHWTKQKDAERVHALFPRRFLSHQMDLVKPDREIFDSVAKALGCPADAIFFMDDNLINVQGARSAGWDAARAVGVEEARQLLSQRSLLA